MPTTIPDYRTLMAKALQEIKELKSKLRRLEAERAEPIAVIGMSCRFPGGANSPDDYWKLLRNGVDAIREIPAERWDVDRFYDPDRNAPGKAYTRYGGFIDDIAGFDASFFNISPREAESLDPHQRILLEVCWEALEYANLIPENLYGANAGVYIGVSSLDQILNRIGEVPLSEIGPYHGTGCALAPIAGRVSYNFGFTGPSFVMDTACSSSLLSLHLASEGLRRRECDLALAGGVHFLFHPGYFVAFSKASMLSADGRCKTFDATANGYARGEGCGVLVLKRREDALRDGDSILALIRGSAVNQDGASGGLTVPSGPSQEQVVRQALARGGIDPAQVSYIEAHGTGTPLGDPIEIGALGNVFRQPLFVGSVKTNIGHLEASAGIAAAMKVILAMRHQQIPPHLHLRNPNPLIPWANLPLTIPTCLTPWPTTLDNERIAGISAFAFSGTNVHLVLSDTIKTTTLAPPTTAPESPRAQHLLILSARSLNALQALARKWSTGPLSEEQVDFAGLCTTAATCRTAFSQRLAIVARDAETARVALAQFADKGEAEGVQSSHLEPGRPKVAFLFTGQGSQAVGMGQELYHSEPVFRTTLDQCDRLLRVEWGHSLLELLYPEDEANRTTQATLLDATANTQPALFALEYALAQLWQSWGIRPTALLGHSVGEYVAACLAGVFSLEEGIRLIVARARLMQALPAGGAMAAVLADPTRVEAEVAAQGGGLTVAAYNGPRNTVISGPAAPLEAVLSRFESQEIEYRRLAVSHAFHSVLMEPMLEEFRHIASRITYAAPRVPIISNVSGKVVGPEIATADYWVRHVRAPVRFSAGVQELLRLGCGLLIEVGPAAILTGMARQNLDAQVVCVASLHKRKSDTEALLGALGTYWLHGGEVNWPVVVGPPRRDLRLPTYPFQHQSYWRKAEVDIARDRLQGVTTLNLPLLAYHFTSPLVHEHLFETVFSKQALPFLEDHRVFGQLVVAGTSHLSLILSAAGLVGMKVCTLREVIFPMALVVPEEGARVVQLVVATANSGSSSLFPVPQETSIADEPAEFRLVSLGEPGQEPNLHARGRIVPGVDAEVATDFDAISRRCTEEIPVAEVYDFQRQRHIVVGASYQWLNSLRRGVGESIARLSVPPVLATSIERYSLHPGLIDSCFGAMVMTQPITVDGSFIPFALDALHFHSTATSGTYLAYARVRRHDELRMIGDIYLYTEQGQPVATFIGLEGRRASQQALLAPKAKPTPALYGLAWEALAKDTLTATISGHWLVLRQNDTLGQHLVSALRTQVKVSEVVLETGNSEEDPTSCFLLPSSYLDSYGPFDGVLYLWGLADDARSACAGALHLLQALAMRNRPISASDRLPVLLVTRGARAVRSHDSVSAPHQALLWGLGQVAVEELQELACTCVDLDDGRDTDQCVADILAATSLTGSREDQLAWRDGSGYVARLAPMPTPVAQFSVQVDHTYLITGASGALGRELALWLAEHGVRHLALLARRPIGTELLTALARHGVVARGYAVDVADSSALATVLTQIGHEQAPIGAIFHLAGMLDDGMIVGQSWERWEQVLAAKVNGAWNLHQLTQGNRLSVFVTFSSVASLLGTAGQSSYAAANAFLDTLAWHRRANGLSALSINWGPWGGVGMAARLDDQQQERLRAAGVYRLEVGEALDMLGNLLGGLQIGSALAHAQIGVLTMDWQRYGSHHVRPLLKRLVTEDTSDTTIQSLRERLHQNSPNERKTLLTDLLIDLVAESLRLPRTEIAPRERLFDLGVDSLIAVELKNRLQRKLEMTLSTTLLFDYPSIEALVAFLLEQLTPTGGITTSTQAKTQVTDIPSVAINSLSEAEAEALLLAQLERLEEDFSHR